MVKLPFYILVLTVFFASAGSAASAQTVTAPVQTAQAVSPETSEDPDEIDIDKIQLDSKALAAKTEIESKRVQMRWTHAKELLGKYYGRSVVKSGEGVANMDEFLTHWIRRSLKDKWKNAAHTISQTIIHESQKYGFDPVFILSVIQSESNFDPEVIGGVGEVGLMQLTPATAKWITGKSGIPWHGVKSLKDPATNIRIASAYLAYLRDKFDSHSQLYLAAYNMGSGNVYKAREKQIWPKVYPGRVMQKYVLYYAELKEELEKSAHLRISSRAK